MKAIISTLVMAALMCFQGLKAQQSGNLAIIRDSDDTRLMKEHYENRNSPLQLEQQRQVQGFTTLKEHAFPGNWRPKPDTETGPHGEFTLKSTASSASAKVRAVLDSTTFYQYFPSGDSVIREKWVYLTDDRGLRYRGENYRFDSASVSWIKIYAWQGEDLDEDHSDPDSNWWKKTTYYQAHPETGEWLAEYRYLDDVDKNGNKTVDILEVYDLEKEKWIRYRHIETSFNDEGMAISGLEYRFDPLTGDMASGGKFELERDEQGRITLQNSYGYIQETGEWYLSEVFRTSFYMDYVASSDYFAREHPEGDLLHYASDSSSWDNKGRLIRSINYYYDYELGLIGEYRYLYEYNSADYDMIKTEYFFDPANGWTLSKTTASKRTMDQASGLYRTIFYYMDESRTDIREDHMSEEKFDEMDRQLMLTNYYEKDEGDNWIPNNKIMREYSSVNKEIMTRSEFYVWSNGSNDWFSIELLTSTDEGKPLIRKFYEIDWNTGGYAGREWREWQYDDRGRNTVYYQYMWDRDLSDWNGGWYRMTTFSGDESWVESKNYSYDTESGEWWNSSKYRTEYNAFGQALTKFTWKREARGLELVLKARDFHHYGTYQSLLDMRNQPIDEFLDVVVDENTITVSIPIDLLSQSDRENITGFVVSLSNGDGLPTWIRFDLASFSFIIDPKMEKSPMEDGAMHVYLNLLDEEGNSVIFVFSLSEQIREAEQTDIAETSALTGIQLYPNPASDLLFLETSGLKSGTQYRIMLMDAAGRTVLVKELLPAEGRSTIHVEHLPGGVYHLVLEGGSARKLKGTTLLIQ